MPAGRLPAAPLRSSPLLAGKQLTRGGCQRCWLLDPAAATCSPTCKPGQAYANGWGRAPGAGERGNGGGGRSPASKFPPPTPPSPRFLPSPLLHHHLPASICLPSSSSSASIHKIRAALPSTVACDGQPRRHDRHTGNTPRPQAHRPAGTPLARGSPAPSPALVPAALPKPPRDFPRGRKATLSLPLNDKLGGSLCPAPHPSLRPAPAVFRGVSWLPSGGSTAES